MKRLVTMFFALFLCLLLPIQASAADMPRLVDAADLLAAEEETELLHRLDEVSEKLQVDVVIVTLESLGGYTADEVVNALFDQYHYGMGENRNGVILMLSMAERDWRILSNGSAADAVTPAYIDRIGQHIVEELSAGEYMEGFMEFVSLCKWEIEDARTFDFGKSLLISLAIGIAVALIVTGIMRSRLKSVRSRTGAREYTVPGSMELKRSSDLFLYHTVSRRHKPQQSSSGSRSSGGGGRNVGGGKF